MMPSYANLEKEAQTMKRRDVLKKAGVGAVGLGAAGLALKPKKAAAEKVYHWKM